MKLSVSYKDSITCESKWTKRGAVGSLHFFSTWSPKRDWTMSTGCRAAYMFVGVRMTRCTVLLRAWQQEERKENEVGVWFGLESLTELRVL